MTKKWLKFIGLNLVLLLLTALVVQRGLFLGIQSGVQNRFYDFDQANPDIVIVEIDEKSLSEEGGLGRLTEWKRADYARVIETLSDAGARAIGVDITFPDGSPHGTEDDEALANALRESPNVVMAARTYTDAGALKAEFPNDTLMAANPALGWINVKLDADGFVRQLPLFSLHRNQVVPAFSLALATRYLQTEVSSYEASHGWLDLDSYERIPVVNLVDEERRLTQPFMNINYFAAPGTYEPISFVDVLNGRFFNDLGTKIDVRDKIVLIGPTAIDLQDLYLSPVSDGAQMAGVEVHANAIQTIIENRFLRNLSTFSLWLTLLLVLLVNGFLFALLRARYATPLFVLQVIGWLVAGIVLYETGLLLNVVYPIFVLIISFSGTFLLRYVLEEKERKFVEQAFGHYVNPTVVEQIKKDPSLLHLGGAKREATVFFSDIAHFTSISEQLKPEQLVTLLNDYLGAMTDVILKHNGTLDKYEGDAIVAFWNAPVEQKDHAVQACLAALENQTSLIELRKQWKQKGYPDLNVRIGLNTGLVVAGNMGSTDRFDYTVMGDAVNLGSRLEGVNKVYGTSILISENTYELVKDELVCREVDLIRVKGKQEVIRIFELIGKRSEVNEDRLKSIQRFEEGLERYRKRNFLAAADLFRSLAKKDPVAQLFLERCETLQKNPPSTNWDGVWELNEK